MIGHGADFYRDEVQHHPMAYALYARAFVSLHASGARPGGLAEAGAALDRLHGLSTAQGCAWGLGFPWRSVSADEPYAVTTAAALLAYLDHHQATGSPVSLARAVAAGRWLTDTLPWQDAGAGAGPRYAPRAPWVLPNVTALVGGALSRLQALTGLRSIRAAAVRARETILAARDPAGFWSYGDAGGKRERGLDPALTVDAVHMGYILDGLGEMALGGLGNGRVNHALRVGFRFVADALLGRGGRLREKVVPARSADPGARELLENPRLGRRALEGGRLLVVFPQETRLWGYGALLGAGARALRAGALSDPACLEHLLGRVVACHLNRSSGRLPYLPADPRSFPRHEAHAIEGVTAWLRATAGRGTPPPGGPR